MGLGWVKAESVRGEYIPKFLHLCYTATRKEQIQRNGREHYETTERVPERLSKTFFRMLLVRIGESAKEIPSL